MTARDWGIPVVYLQAGSGLLTRRAEELGTTVQVASAETPSNLDRVPHRRCANLVGRGDDMIRLAKAMREPGPRRRFVTVTGLGGIGKSSLAVECAFWHIARQYYPQGVHWFDARAASVEGLFNDMATALGIGGFSALDIAARRAVLSGALEENRLLFVVDNADSLRDDAEFRLFLAGLSPTPRGTLLLTARLRMEVDGEKEVELDRIDLASAMGLFVYTWGAVEPTDEQMKQVAAICGRGMLEGHPLGIAVAAAVARKEQNPDLSSLRQRLRERMIETLRDQRTPKEQVSVEASLRLSWDALGDAGRTLLARASVLRLPFREEAADAVMEGLGDWRPAMGELLEHHLVMRLGGRYHIHPVVQAFAARELTSPEDVHLKAGEFLVGTKFLEEHLEGIDHLETAEAWQKVVDSVSAIVDQLHLQGYWDVAGVKLEQGLRAARELGDRKSEGYMLTGLGSNHVRRGSFREAVPCFERALAIDRQIGDRLGEGHDLGNLGNAYVSLGDARKATQYYEQSLAIAREIGDRQGEATSLGNLGNVYVRLADARKAIQYFEQSVAIARETGNRQLEANSLGNLGVAFFRLGDFNRAIQLHEQSLSIAREIGDRQLEANNLSPLGSAYFALGDFNKAIQHHEQALAITREIGHRKGEGDALGSLGSACLRLGVAEKAMQYYEQALAIAREIGDRHGESNRLGGLGNVCFALGDVSKTMQCHEQALAIAREIGNRHGEAASLGNLGIAHVAWGEDERGLAYLLEAEGILAGIGSPEVANVRGAMAVLRNKLGAAKYRRLETRLRKRAPKGSPSDRKL